MPILANIANIASRNQDKDENVGNFTIIALGGSILVSNKIQEKFLKRLYKFLTPYLEKGRKFIVVVGGGATARNYQNAAGNIIKLTNEDKDWLGVHSTRLNAHLIRTIFYKYAYPVVLDSPEKPIKKRDLKKYALFVASGWKPGWSTDYIAFRLAERFGRKEVLIATKIPYIYDKDIHKYKDAKPIEALSWDRYYNEILPNEDWQPGMKSPVDPIAAKYAMREGLNCVLLRGTNLANLRQYLEGDKFAGTVISSQ